MKYIKPPRLSTSFSAGKHRARKRFENILKRGGKKTGIFALIAAVMITAAIGLVFVRDKSEKAPQLSEERLYELAVNIVGSDMAELEYASEERVILYYGGALIVYDLNKGEIERSVDVLKLNVSPAQQGDSAIDIRVSEDGSGVYIGSVGQNEDTYDKYWYDIESGQIEEYSENREFFGNFYESEYENADGWISYRSVKISDSESCYLLLKSPSWLVAGIRIMLESDSGVKEYRPFMNGRIAEAVKYSEPPDNGRFAEVDIYGNYTIRYIPITDEEYEGSRDGKEFVSSDVYGRNGIHLYRNMEEYESRYDIGKAKSRQEEMIPRRLLELICERSGYEIHTPGEIHDIVSAEMSCAFYGEEGMEGQLKDSDALKRISDILVKAKPSDGGGCPYIGKLTLTRKDGENVTVRLAADGCPFYLIGSGTYYEIDKSDMQSIWELFPEIDNYRKGGSQ